MEDLSIKTKPHYKNINFDLLESTKTTTDIFIDKRKLGNFSIEDLPLILEEEDGSQWHFSKAFAEPTGPRSWTDYLHYKLHYASPKKIADLLTSPNSYEREYGRKIANNKAKDNY